MFAARALTPRVHYAVIEPAATGVVSTRGEDAGVVCEVGAKNGGNNGVERCHMLREEYEGGYMVRALAGEAMRAR